MAIGIRITSNNLDGKVANVTFNPTTGGTINIGNVTIPFNYITDNPYGTYQVYVPFYDYTYELEINQPVDVKSLVFASKLTTNNNWGIVNLNYGELTATIFDFGIDNTGWYLSDLYPLTDSGYGFYFNNNDNSCLKWVKFTDSLGNVIDEFQINTDCDYDYNILSGKFLTFEDYTNGVLKIFNGKEVFNITADSATQQVYTIRDYDGVTSNDTIIIAYKTLSDNTFTVNLFKDGILTPFGDVYDYDTQSLDFKTYFDGSFVYVTIFDTVIENYTYVKIYDSTTGDLLQTVDISSYSAYTTSNFTFYGNNKSINIYWSYFDDSVDYLIIQYNGNTDVLNVMTHNRSNYNEYPNLNAKQNLYPNNGGSEAFSIILLKNSGYNNIGTIVSYCDVIYMLSGDTSLQTLVFQDSGLPDKTFRNYFSTSNNLFTTCDNGDGKVSILSITNSGVNYHDTNLLMSNNPQVSDMVDCGNGYVTSYFDNNSYNQMTIAHVTENGVMADIINGIQLTGSYQRNTEYIGNIYYFRPYTGDTYYIAPNSDSFQVGTITGNTFYSYYPESYFKSDFIRRGNIVYVNYNNNECTILTQSGLTSTFTLPTSNNYNIRPSDDSFLYVYNDDISGFTHFNLYDYDFNLLNSGSTEFTSFWNVESRGGDYMVTINENNRYYVYLISENEITYKELSDNDSYYTYNDYVWWD